MLADANAASATLATYYEDLTTITLDGWQNQGVFNAIQGMPAPAPEQYQERVRAFQGRADLAHSLSLVYQSLQQLHNPASVGRVTTAGQNLGHSIQSLTTVPGAGKIPTDQLGSAAAFLLNLQRERDLKRALSEMASVTDGIAAIFGNEQHVYLSVSAERTGLGRTLIGELAKRKLVSPSVLLQGLHLGLPIANSTDAEAAAAGLVVAEIAAQRTNLAWQCATQDTQNMVTILAAAERAIKTGQPGQFANLEEETAQATTCVKEHDDLIKGRQ
ncbi:MAG: hypothetical protein ACLQU1_35610 [Bryobacteraceae bacterium]